MATPQIDQLARVFDKRIQELQVRSNQAGQPTRMTELQVLAQLHEKVAQTEVKAGNAEYERDAAVATAAARDAALQRLRDRNDVLTKHSTALEEALGKRDEQIHNLLEELEEVRRTNAKLENAAAKAIEEAKREQDAHRWSLEVTERKLAAAERATQHLEELLSESATHVKALTEELERRNQRIGELVEERQQALDKVRELELDAATTKRDVARERADATWARESGERELEVTKLAHAELASQLADAREQIQALGTSLDEAHRDRAQSIRKLAQLTIVEDVLGGEFMKRMSLAVPELGRLSY